MRQGVDLGLQHRRVLALEGLFRRRRRVDPRRLLGQVPAVAGDQPPSAGLAAQLVGHDRHRVHDIVVARPARVRQPTGHGEAPRIVQRQPQFLRADLHRHGEAGVEVDEVDPVQIDAGHGQRFLPGAPHRRARVEVLPVQRVPQVRRVCAAMQVDPLALRHAQFARLPHRAHDHARRLIHLHDRVDQLRIRKPDHPVLVGHRHQFFCRPLHGEPRLGVPSRHLREAREQPPYPRLVVGDRAPIARPQGVLEQRIDVDRPVQSVPLLIVGDAPPRIADPLRRLQVLILLGRPVVEAELLGQPLHRRAQELRAHGQRQLGLAASDPLGQRVDQVLRRVAAHVGIDAPARACADTFCEGRGRIDRVRDRPAPRSLGVDGEAHHRQRIDRRQAGGAYSGVLGGPFRRNLQQVGRRRRNRRIAPVRELAHSDQNRGPFVHALAPPTPVACVFRPEPAASAAIPRLHAS